MEKQPKQLFAFIFKPACLGAGQGVEQPKLLWLLDYIFRREKRKLKLQILNLPKIKKKKKRVPRI